MAEKKVENAQATYNPNTEVVRKKYDVENISRREYSQGKGTYDAEYYRNHKEYFSKKHEKYYKESYKRVPLDVPREWYNTLTNVIDSMDASSSVNGFIKQAVEYYVANELKDSSFADYHTKKALTKQNGLACSKCQKEVSSFSELFLSPAGDQLLCENCK